MNDSPSLSMPKIHRNDFALQGLRVLVVDDDLDSCDLIVMTLESFAAEPQAVFSAQQAIEAFTQFRPDVLISDIAMPNEDGYALIRQIRAIDSERANRIPAIAVTALASEESDRRARLAGFQRWLPKPLDLDALIDTIVALTGRTVMG